MTDFVYRGVPDKDEFGLVVSVTPFRGVSADDGLSYRGVLSEDSDGNLFVYRGYPDTIEPRPQPPPVAAVPRLFDNAGRLLLDRIGRRIHLRGEEDGN